MQQHGQRPQEAALFIVKSERILKALLAAQRTIEIKHIIHADAVVEHGGILRYAQRGTVPSDETEITDAEGEVRCATSKGERPAHFERNGSADAATFSERIGRGVAARIA